MPGVFEPTQDGGARLVSGRCTNCGAYSFPKRNVCARCGPGSQVEQVMVSGQGRVYASTVVRVPSPVGLKPPYAYGYVDMDDVPLRVFALFSRRDVEGISPGEPVRLVSEALYPDPRGGELIAYKFTRAGEAA